jgi:AhpD family alkylhydroperoxidase
MTCKIRAATLLLAGAVGSSALAQDAGAPNFMAQTFPESGVVAAWQEFQAVMSEDGALDGVTKELIALGVSARIPCDYCVYYHREAAMAKGASEQDIKEALASAALVRQWSTMLQGAEYDMTTWRKEVDSMFATQ